MGQFVIGVAVGTWIVVLIQFLRLRGWDHHPKDWWSRCHARVVHEYRRDEHGCWVWTPFELSFGRRHETGIFGINLCVLGVIVNIAILVDRDEAKRFEAQREAKRAEMMQAAKSAFSEMMSAVTGAEIVDVSPNGTGADDEDEDDKDKVH